MQLESDVAHGTLHFNANGSFSYLPDEDFTGVDSFTYRATDGTHLGNIATVTIAVGVCATVENDSYTVAEGSTLSVPMETGVLVNDKDLQDDDETFRRSDQGRQHEVLTFSSDGSFTYVPVAGFVGVDSFTYRARDSESNLKQDRDGDHHGQQCNSFGLVPVLVVGNVVGSRQRNGGVARGLRVELDIDGDGTAGEVGDQFQQPVWA
ncbi:MAG: Ig-like domain-containing protein [Planctomycetota bacterium]